MILSALLCTLNEYSSWRVGRGVPMILPAVWTICCSLLRPDLVAEPNQTDSYRSAKDRFSDCRVELQKQHLRQVELPQTSE